MIGGVELPAGTPGAGSGASSGSGALAGQGGGGAANVQGGAGSGGSEAGAAGSGGQPNTCQPAAAHLIHRYTFDTVGTSVVDSIASAHGDLLGGATLDGSGRLTLDGSDDYVNLPNGLISSLDDVTFVLWTTWQGGAGFQRVFDFGTSSLGEDLREYGESYIALIPFTRVAVDQHIAVELDAPLHGRAQIASPVPLQEGSLYQIAVVFRSGEQVELYLDSRLVGSTATTISLSDIDDVNNWFGRSQWDADHNYNGSLEEFRIYSDALSSCDIELLFDAGPDTLP